MKKDLNYYAKKFAKLNVNRNNGAIAPATNLIDLCIEGPPGEREGWVLPQCISQLERDM